MVEMSVLKELYALRTQIITLSYCRLEGTLVFGLATEATVARLEVRASDVAHRHLVESLVDLAA